MKKIIIGILAVAAIGFGVWKYNSQTTNVSSQSTDKPTIKIGVITPLTGASAMIGNNCMNGIRFALDSIKNSQVKYDVMFEDDRFQLADAAKIANKFVNIDKVDILFACSTPSGNGAVSIAKNAKQFMMTVIASATEVATENPYGFLHWTSSKAEGSKAAELASIKGAKKVVVFEQNHAGAKALGDAYREGLKERGIETVTYTYMASERNFHDIIAKADRDNADLFMMLTLPPSVDIIAKILKEKGINTPLTSIEIPTLIEDKSAFEGVKFVDVYDGKPEIMDEYKKKYNTENTYGVAFAYDGIMIINEIVNRFYDKNGRVPNSEELTDTMYNLGEWNGVVGSVTVGKDRVLRSEAVLKKVVNGKPVMIGE